MKKVLLGLLATVQLFAAPVITSTGGYELNRSSTLNRKYHVGTALANGPFGVKGTWDYAVSGGAASSTIYLLDNESQRITLPTGAVVTNCLVDVVTAPTSDGASANLAFHMQSNGEVVKAATHKSVFTTTLPIVCTQTGSVSNMLKLASETSLTVRIASEAMTAGKINVWLQYVLSN